MHSSEVKDGNAPELFWRQDACLTSLCLDDYETFSFDVFDTLIYRRVDNPEVVFEYVARDLRKAGLLNTDIDDGNFRALRAWAANKAYKSLALNETDPSLVDIYRNIPPLRGLADISAEIEIQTERKLIRSNPLMLSLLQELRLLDKSIVFLSDMYLTESNIRELLSSCGITPDLYDFLHVSRDERVSKRSGGLYEKLTDVSPDKSKIIHIGDNYTSDIIEARKFGIDALYYSTTVAALPSFDFHEEIFREDCHQEDNEISIKRLATKIQRETSYSRRNFTERKNVTFLPDRRELSPFWYKFGASVLGPFLVGFSDWVIQEAKKNNVRIIFALMRDAHILKPLIESAARRQGWECDVEALWVSRQSLMLVAGGGDFNSKIEFWLKTPISIFNLMSRLGLNVAPDLEKYAQYPVSHLKNEHLHTGQRVHERIAEILSANREAVELGVIREKDCIYEYFEKLFPSCENVMLVDHSSNNTLGKTISDLKVNNCKVICAITWGKRDIIARQRTEGVDVSGWLASDSRNHTALLGLSKKGGIFEELFYGEDGTTLGYVRTDSGIEPTTAPRCVDRKIIDIRKETQIGIGFFDKVWESSFRVDEPIFLSPVAVCRSLSRVVSLPSPEEVEHLGELTIDSGYQGGNMIKLISTSAKQEILSEGITKFLLSNHRNGCYWKRGAVMKYFPRSILENYLNKHSKSNLGLEFYLLLLDMKAAGIKRILVHGAGEAGKMACQAVLDTGLCLASVSDKNSSLHGESIFGCMVEPYNSALSKKPDAVVIASRAFAAEIREELKRWSGSSVSSEKIYDLNTPVL